MMRLVSVKTGFAACLSTTATFGYNNNFAVSINTGRVSTIDGEGYSVFTGSSVGVINIFFT